MKVVFDSNDLPDVFIEVRKENGLPVLMVYELVIDEDDDEEVDGEFASVGACSMANLSLREYRKWKKLSPLRKLAFAADALKELLQIDCH